MKNDNENASLKVPLKICLVDDNENNLLSMEVTLENDNYRFTRQLPEGKHSGYC